MDDVLRQTCIARVWCMGHGSLCCCCCCCGDLHGTGLTRVMALFIVIAAVAGAEVVRSTP